MKSLVKLSLTSAFVFLPLLTSAGSAEAAAAEAASFVAKLNEIIIFPLIALLSAVAFLVFLWGCAQYFINATNDQARQQGVQHITFGIIGLVVMLSAFAILSIAVNTFDLGDQLECANTGAGCIGAFEFPEPAGPGTPPGGAPEPAGPGTPPGGAPDPAGPGTPPGG